MEGASPSDEFHARWYTNALATWTLAVLMVLGRIRDALWARLWRGAGGGSGSKALAPLVDPHAAFYARRIYGRIHDCWNRPIASAPGPWVDVLEREPLEGRMRATRALPLTGRRLRCVNLGSYNYLGFGGPSAQCVPHVMASLDRWGVSACSSRTEGGATPLHRELEAAVAAFVGADDAVAFGMGFATNASALLPLLCGPGTLVLSDALNHTSLVAGMRARGAATIRVFRHNDVRHLEALLRYHIAEDRPRTRPWRKVVIVIEGLYSMEGDAPPLAAIVALKKRYGAYLYLDEAHSIGALGATGRGLCEHAGVDPRDVDVLMGTFTKAFGSAGGYIAGSRALARYVRRHAPAHLHAAAMAPGAAAQALAALRELGSERGCARVAALHANAAHCRARLLAAGLHVLGSPSTSPVLPLLVYHVGALGAASRALLRRRVAAVAVGFPATPLLVCRVRICVGAAHSREDLDYALDAIIDVARAAGLDFGRRRGSVLQWFSCLLFGDTSSSSSGSKGIEKDSGGCVVASCLGATSGSGDQQQQQQQLDDKGAVAACAIASCGPLLVSRQCDSGSSSSSDGGSGGPALAADESSSLGSGATARAASSGGSCCGSPVQQRQQQQQQARVAALDSHPLFF